MATADPTATPSQDPSTISQGALSITTSTSGASTSDLYTAFQQQGGSVQSSSVSNYGNTRFPSDIDAIDNWCQFTIYSYSRENRASNPTRQTKGTITLPVPP